MCITIICCCHRYASTQFNNAKSITHSPRHLVFPPSASSGSVVGASGFRQLPPLEHAPPNQTWPRRVQELLPLPRLQTVKGVGTSQSSPHPLERGGLRKLVSLPIRHHVWKGRYLVNAVPRPLLHNYPVWVSPEAPAPSVHSREEVAAQGVALHCDASTPRKTHNHPLIGAELVKNFESDVDHLMHPFHGTVVSFKRPYYKVVYTDGDEEEMSAAQVREHLASLPKHQPPRKSSQNSEQPALTRLGAATPNLAAYAASSPLASFLVGEKSKAVSVDVEESCSMHITPPSGWDRLSLRQQKRVAHPSGQEMAFLQPLPVLGSTPSQRFNASLHNAGVFIFRSVQESTKGAYQTGFRHWLKNADTMGIDPMLRTPPTWWRPSACAYPFQVAVVMAFLSHLAFEKHLAPSTCNSYMSGVRFNLINCGTEMGFLEKSQPIRSLRAGILLEWRSKHAKADSKRLPFTVDMILATRRLFDDGSPIGEAICVAVELGFCCIMRVSEYICVPWANHHLRACDVIFWVMRNRTLVRILSSAVVSDKVDYSEVHLVSIHIRDSKNDIESEGHVITFEVAHAHLAAAPGRSQAFDLVRHLFEWAKRAQPGPLDPFLSFHGEWALPYAFINTACKCVAAKFGLPLHLVSSHSIRIGGASTMAAAMQPDFMIKLLGRWKSLEFLEYIRLCSTEFASALRSLTDPTLFTVDHVRQMCAGAARSTSSGGDSRNSQSTAESGQSPLSPRRAALEGGF